MLQQVPGCKLKQRKRAQVKAEEALRGSIPVREGHSGGLEVVGKHERLENYLRVVSVGIGDDRKWGRGGAMLLWPCAQRTAALPAREGGDG